MARHVAVHIAVGGNQHIVPNRYSSDNGRVDAEPNTVTEHRSSLALAAVLLPNRHTLVDVAISTDNRIGVHGDTVSMTDVEPLPDSRFSRYLKAVMRLHLLSQEAPHGVMGGLAFAK